MRTSKRETMRYLTIAAVLLALTALPFAQSWSSPPHPRLMEQVAAQKATAPYFMANLDAMHAKGICTGEHAVDWKVKDNRRSLQASSQVTGNYRILALLVHFSDNTSSVSASFFDTLLFQTSSGSVRDYYNEISYGQLDLITVNFPSSTNWQMMPQTYAYYVNGENGTGSYPNNTQKLTEDLVDLVDPLVDFSQYDNDGDGTMDALVIVHAGSGGEWTGSNDDIWSHQWGINPRLKDSVYISSYTIQPEYWGSAGDMTIGVYSHELGHVFGLPDLYDIDYTSNGIGYWGIMSFGSWLGPGYNGSSPAHPTAWSRGQLGFAPIVNVEFNVDDQVIPNVEANPSIFRLWNAGADSDEYFLIENRQKTGFDSYLPGSGLLVWHVDETKLDNTQEWWPGEPSADHFKVALKQADGVYEMEQSVDLGDASDPFPGTLAKTSFGSVTTPNSNAYDNSSSSVAIQNIHQTGSNIIADLFVGIAAAVSNESGDGDLPHTLTLSQNYPNPFNPQTTINFTVTHAGQAKLELFNMLGQRVAILLDEYVSPGTTTITWNTRDESGKTVASGTYLYRLKIGNETSSKKMVLIR